MQVNQMLHKSLLQSKIVPVYYHNDIEVSKTIVTACVRAGLQVFEWVHRGEKAIENYVELKKFIIQNNFPIELIVGTITSLYQAKAYHSAGAKAMVSPFFVNDVAEYCSAENLGYIPGCFTPTEVFNAQSLGSNWVKIFPASTVGAAYIKAIKAVLPNINVMATGGIKPVKEDILQWLSSGTNAIGMGSELFKELNTSVLENNISNLLKSLN